MYESTYINNNEFGSFRIEIKYGNSFKWKPMRLWIERSAVLTSYQNQMFMGHSLIFITGSLFPILFVTFLWKAIRIVLGDFSSLCFLLSTVMFTLISVACWNPENFNICGKIYILHSSINTYFQFCVLKYWI